MTPPAAFQNPVFRYLVPARRPPPVWLTVLIGLGLALFLLIKPLDCILLDVQTFGPQGGVRTITFESTTVYDATARAYHPRWFVSAIWYNWLPFERGYPVCVQADFTLWQTFLYGLGLFGLLSLLASILIIAVLDRVKGHEEPIQLLKITPLGAAAIIRGLIAAALYRSRLLLMGLAALAPGLALIWARLTLCNVTRSGDEFTHHCGYRFGMLESLSFVALTIGLLGVVPLAAVLGGRMTFWPAFGERRWLLPGLALAAIAVLLVAGRGLETVLVDCFCDGCYPVVEMVAYGCLDDSRLTTPEYTFFVVWPGVLMLMPYGAVWWLLRGKQVYNSG